MLTASLDGSAHENRDEVADRSLRITTEHMEQVHRELETEWHKRRADHYRDEMIRTNEMTEQKMREAKRYFQEQSMRMCHAAATANKEDIARTREEADEKYQKYIATIVDQINRHHAANREQLIHHGRVEMQQALKAQEDALAAEYAARAEGYESQIRAGWAQIFDS